MMGNLPECACKLQSVQQFLTTNGMTPMPHRPHSPNLTPRDFFVSPDKKALKRKHFANVENVKQKTAEALKVIKIDKFKNCFEPWEK